MNFWNNVVQTAMLGTDKKDIAQQDDLPEELLAAVKIINDNAVIDAEEKFIQTAALGFNYRQSGTCPNPQPDATLSLAPDEEKLYCNAEAVQALKDILFEDSVGLLKIWLQLCVQKNQIVTPALIPALMDKSVQQKHLKTLVQQCVGQRGAWLSQFNSEWNFAREIKFEDLWQTGTPAERKNTLQQLRISDASKAREWLKETWPVENANSKNDLLSAMSINISSGDIEWLECLLNEKSQKVKDQVLQLLKQIPTSTIVKQYEEFLSQSISIRKEKGLLGLSSKTIIHFDITTPVGENIFKSGIEKLSNRKEFSDDEYIIYQLMQSVPVQFWEKQFSLSPAEIIQMFQKDEIKKKFIPAMISAVVQFKDTGWADAFMKNSQVFYLDIIPLLSVEQQEYYSNKFFSGHEESIIGFALQRDEDWSTELAKNIFKHTAKNYYTYNRAFYNRHIHLIPVQIVGLLEKCTPQEEHLRESWSHISDYIIKLITLKIETIKAFQ